MKQPVSSLATPKRGRPKGSPNAISRAAREEAAKTGLLPHEWLLKIARGEPVMQREWKVQYDKQGNEKIRELVEREVYADFETRIDAAKAAAPYYAPRLATQTVSLKGDSSTLSGVMRELAEKLPV